MKSYKKYGAAALLTATTVTMLSFGSLGFAQTVTPTTCTVSGQVEVNQAATITASGGNGAYTISGVNGTTVAFPGNQYAVSFATAGTYPVSVTSAGQSGTCNVTVVASTAASNAVMCSPTVQTVNVGQNTTFSATGGNGSFNWTSPDITINNGTGSGFSASFASVGIKHLTVSSNSTTATCTINVLPAVVNGGGSIPPVVTPTLPATGGGFGK